MIEQMNLFGERDEFAVMIDHIVKWYEEKRHSVQDAVIQCRETSVSGCSTSFRPILAVMVARCFGENGSGTHLRQAV